MTRPIRVLYVLNAMGGGASLGIYEFLRRLRQQPETEGQIAAYAVVPPGTAQQFEQMRPLFADVCVTPLLWWNRKTELDPLRRAARAFGSLRRGITQASNVTTIQECIERWQIDVVHTGTALTLAGPLAAEAARVPHIWHIKESIGSQNRVRFALPDDQLVATMDRLSAAIIAMSEYIGGIFRAHGSQKLVVIPDGVDLSRYEHGTSKNLRGRLADTQTVLVGMVGGTVSTWKRHDLFIQAAAQLIPRYPHVRFVIVGEKPNPAARFPNDGALKYYQRLARQAAQIRPAGQFEFVDHMADPADLMRSLDMLVHPCDTEPFGRVAIEAQAAGTPVIGTTTGGIAETVIDGETGLLVAAGDAAGFAGAIERMIDDAGLRRRLGDAGKLHAAAQYPVEAMLERLTALYNKVYSEAAP